ncbi:MAG: hypothetical protein K6E85_07415 [Lachnospiraceae bacterium]|nr:hypothetical protein [Lachnospiraceae bacterium]
MVSMEEREKEASEQVKRKPVNNLCDIENLLVENNYTVIRIDNPRQRGKIRYKEIAKDNNLINEYHIIWIKFAKSKDKNGRYIGVVGAGCDINRYWNNSNISGKLVEKAELEWDESVVFIIPIPWLSKECQGHHTAERNDVEREIGNLLGENFPIIDFYSHNL